MIELLKNIGENRIMLVGCLC